MTSIKEALEAGLEYVEDFDSKLVVDQRSLREGKEVALAKIKTALAQLESDDARETIARVVTSELEQMYKDGVPMCMREGETTWRTYYSGFDLSMFANRIVDAILATGPVSDEAAIRAGRAEG